MRAETIRVNRLCGYDEYEVTIEDMVEMVQGQISKFGETTVLERIGWGNYYSDFFVAAYNLYRERKGTKK